MYVKNGTAAKGDNTRNKREKSMSGTRIPGQRDTAVTFVNVSNGKARQESIYALVSGYSGMGYDYGKCDIIVNI